MSLRALVSLFHPTPGWANAKAGPGLELPVCSLPHPSRHSAGVPSSEKPAWTPTQSFLLLFTLLGCLVCAPAQPPARWATPICLHGCLSQPAGIPQLTQGSCQQRRGSRVRGARHLLEETGPWQGSVEHRSRWGPSSLPCLQPPLSS